MKTLRLAIAVSLILVVAGGYALSQYYYILGPEDSAAYEAKVNDPRVNVLMLVLFVAAIVIGFIPNKEDRSQ